MPRPRLLLLLPVLLIATLLLAACGGDDDDDDDGSTPTATATATAGGGGATSVAVSLTDFAVGTDVESVAAGEVEFAISNDGSLAHQFTVIRTDLAADALPTDGGRVAGVDIVGETNQFSSGATERLTATLTAGGYALICNVPGHYDLGMRIAFTVE